MNPSPAAMSWINTFTAALSGGWAGNTNAAIVAAANTPAVANPSPQGIVPKPFTAADLVGACSSANRPNLGQYLIGAGALIIAQDAVHLSAGLDGMALVGAISAADATAMKTAVSATEPDPSWPSQIGHAQAALGRPIDTSDAADARALYAPGT